MGSARDEFQQRSRELAALPRAERFEKLLSFPVSFTFKVIGKGSDFWEEVRVALVAHGHKDIILQERPSAHGRFFAITFQLEVASGVMVDQIYSLLEGLPGVAFVL